MALKLTIVSASVLLAMSSGFSCSTDVQGTDSNTHWFYCHVDADCPTDGGAFECRNEVCVAVSATGGAASGGAATGGAATGGVTGTGGAGTGGTSMSSGGASPATGGAAGSRPDAGRAIDSGAADASNVSRACQRSGDCVLVDTTCCGNCGGPNPGDKVAINAGSTGAWRSEVCGDNSGGCPPCFPSNGTYQAFCDGECAVHNMAQQMECLQDRDCTIKPKDCCACGALTRLAVMPINVGSSPMACGEDCVPCPGGVQLPDVQAICNSQGSCRFSDEP